MKLNKIYLFLIFCFCSLFSFAQTNLVPNPSFELYSGCPNNPVPYEFDSLLTWINPSRGSGSPDYFNQCASGGVGVPNNFYGYQQANSGFAYCGLACYYTPPPNFREYIEVPLTSSLMTGSIYLFEMYVSLGNASKFTTDAIGVYFSDTIVTGINNFNPLPFTPQINNLTGFIVDTLNWTLISGNYTAVGGENYLIIGNFRDDLNTSTMVVNSCCANGASFYIDDVSLTLISGVSISEQSQIPTFSISPNPSNGIFTISHAEPPPSRGGLVSASQTLKQVQGDIEIYNALGELVSPLSLRREVGGEVEIDLSSQPKGIYFITLKSTSGAYSSQKLVIQ